VGGGRGGDFLPFTPCLFYLISQEKESEREIDRDDGRQMSRNKRETRDLLRERQETHKYINKG
jgi:hypothetical protein